MTRFVPKNKLITLVGHYGSGKSELAINLALLFSVGTNNTVYLVDLDIVNPYFRSRERADFLCSEGIKEIASAEEFPGVDLPYVPGEVAAVFQNKDAFGVIDAGGDPAGARVLARYAEGITEAGGDVFFVVNANRPQTKDAESIIKYIQHIEGASGVRITGLINNTHLLNKTEIQDVLEGARVAKDIAHKTGIPLVAHAIDRELAEEASCALRELAATSHELEEPILPIEIYLTKPWE